MKTLKIVLLSLLLGSIAHAATLQADGTITNIVSSSAATSAIRRADISGLSIKPSVIAVSTSDIASLSGQVTIDGVTTIAGNRVLLTAQATASQDGPWVTGVVWTRPDDFAAGQSADGTSVFVLQGTVYAGTGWLCSTLAPNAVIGTNNLTFIQFSGLDRAAPLVLTGVLTAPSITSIADMSISPVGNLTATLPLGSVLFDLQNGGGSSFVVQTNTGVVDIGNGSAHTYLGNSSSAAADQNLRGGWTVGSSLQLADSSVDAPGNLLEVGLGSSLLKIGNGAGADAVTNIGGEIKLYGDGAGTVRVYAASASNFTLENTVGNTELRSASTLTESGAFVDIYSSAGEVTIHSDTSNVTVHADNNATVSAGGATIISETNDGVSLTLDANGFVFSGDPVNFGGPLTLQTSLTSAGGSAVLDWSASNGAFKTSSGAVSINGATTWAANKGIAYTTGNGAADFSLGTGVTNTTSGAFTSGASSNSFTKGISITTAGQYLSVAEGTNACQGASTLVGGTVVVSTTCAKTNSRILLTAQNSSGTVGSYRVSARTNVTSFTILSSSGSDTSLIGWEIFN